MQIRTVKFLSACVMIMGVVHQTATFLPVISDKLALLPESAQGAFLCFSLMCGAMLILSGGVIFILSGKIKEYQFAKKTYLLALVLLVADGSLSISCMSRNPFAWVIFALAVALLFVSVNLLRASHSK